MIKKVLFELLGWVGLGVFVVGVVGVGVGLLFKVRFLLSVGFGWDKVGFDYVFKVRFLFSVFGWDKVGLIMVGGCLGFVFLGGRWLLMMGLVGGGGLRFGWLFGFLYFLSLLVWMKDFSFLWLEYFCNLYVLLGLIVVM